MSSHKNSSGILLWRQRPQLEVLLAHPGGPFWQGTDSESWSIPKGQHEPGESARAAAIREFGEETGCILEVSEEQMLPLGTSKNKHGKVIRVWAVEGEFDVADFTCNTCEIEYPRHSGKYIDIPEMDAAEWFAIDLARTKIFPNQMIFLDRLIDALNTDLLSE